MYNLLRKKAGNVIGILIFSAALLGTQNLNAQRELELNLPDHDQKKYYLGIGLIYNNSRLQASHHPEFLQRDSIMVVNPMNTGGFGLAGLHTYRLSPRFEVRAIFPQLLFSYRNINYHLSYPDERHEEFEVMNKRIESILVGLPVHLKFRSDRINNFRFYMFGGAKVEYDLASNARARRAEELVKLNSMDFGIEAGIGFNFYFPVFILSPEIKISNGLRNIHSRDPYLKYSSSIDQLNSRMVVFSLIFEG